MVLGSVNGINGATANTKVGIGVNAPLTPLHIDGGSDATLAGTTSGYLLMGDAASLNIVIDDNEINARNNSVVSPLYLQTDGGALSIHTAMPTANEIFITATGEVGIGTITPFYSLELGANSAGKPGTNTWIVTSDARFKQDVKPYTEGLAQLMQIKPVKYHYNKVSGYNTEPEYVGVIAQELQQVAPYMVGTFKREGTEYLNVDNGAMTYMLINSVKELKEIIERQQKEIDELKKK